MKRYIHICNMVLNKFGDQSFFIKIANLVTAFLHGNVKYLGTKSFIAFKDVVVLTILIRINLTIVPKNNLKSSSKYI